MLNESPGYFKKSNYSIAYHKLEGRSPGVIYCGGFRSDMSGGKVLAVENFCREKQLAFVRFDYRGHGQSSENFNDLCLGDWKADALQVFDEFTKGPQVIVGSSMGAWISLLVALARKDRVKGFLGIASAPDFTEELIWKNLTSLQREELHTKGYLINPAEAEFEAYPITEKLILDGRNHLLLTEKIPLDIPVSLIHGCKDQDVPWQYSVRLLEALESQQVTLKLVKDGLHRLNREEDVYIILRCLEDLIQNVK